jgi:hypothetical protein
MIHPDMCLEASMLGEVVAVVDCPSTSYLPALRAALGDVRALLHAGDAQRVRAVVHLTEPTVASCGGYQEWKAALPPCQHVLCCRQFNAAMDPPSLWSAHKLQVRQPLLNRTRPAC